MVYILPGYFCLHKNGYVLKWDLITYEEKGAQKMKINSNLVGFIMIVLGLISVAVGLPWLAAPLMPIGVILFVCMKNARMFLDYGTMENGKCVVTARVRQYMVPMIFLNLIRIVYKTRYYKLVTENYKEESKPEDLIEVSAAEYKQLRDYQRTKYENDRVPKDIVKELCAPGEVLLSRRKQQHIWTWVGLCGSATMVFTGDLYAIIMAAVFSGIFAWILVLMAGEYKEAKVKAAAYERYRQKGLIDDHQ